MSGRRPEKADLKEYEHLTQKERMCSGYPYHPGDKQLREDRARARKLTAQFNNAEAEDKEGRRNTLRELLNPSCRDTKIFIDPPFRCDYGYNITFGDNIEMNFDCVFLDCAPITIGKNCLVAPGVHFYAATHPLDVKHRTSSANYYELAFPITVGDNVWIGGKAVICPGVSIGDNSVIGAGSFSHFDMETFWKGTKTDSLLVGSVVTKDVHANAVVAGNPAKVIRHMEPPKDE